MIEKARFWRIINSSKKPIGEVMTQIKITTEGIEDPHGVVFSCLSIPTKDFVRGSRKRHNENKNHLFKEMVGTGESPYNLMLQASLYSKKLSARDSDVFARETEWEKAQDPNVLAWIKEIFRNVK